jgi:diguanylate cyclase (GGDEF)-like protein/PAS domain S-box-containing protein
MHEVNLPIVHGANGSRARVLIVDDEPQVLLAMQDLLNDEFDTVTAPNGQRAIELARSEPELAVVISDQRMPTMSGDQVLEHVGRFCRATRILFTGYADLTGVIRAVNHGHIFAYVTKPWNAEHVRMTVRQAAEQFSLTRDLASERKLLADLMNGAPDAIYFKDRELRFLRANPACAELHRRDKPEALVGWREPELNAGQGGVPEFEAQQRVVIETGTATTDHVTAFERDGTTRWLSASHAPMRNERGDVLGVIGIARDITERKRHEEHIARQAARLSFLAHYDELTQLPKRELLVDRLSQRMAANPHGGEVALVMIDIARFRRINVSLGRRAGDALLFEIVSRVRPLLGADDTLARCDGDTFAWMMCEGRDAAHVAAVIERSLLPRLRAPFELEETELRVSCRVGIALGPSDGDSAEQLIRHAEAALHKAAVSSQPYVFYAPIMNERVAERLALESRLRRAIEHDEFILHYQPKLELKTGTIVGLEALIRWQDPEHGLVPPIKFIPVLEETGLILDVGRWVYRHAAMQYIRWTQEGFSPPPIAVNVSSVELGQGDFLDAIAQASSDFPLADGGIELEITESVLMDDLHGNIEKLRQVRERGLRVAIDDFGTGYSSLGYLSRLPIDALKVDRSFVTRMAEDPQDMTIVMMIISLAHALDLKVIAEGPETMHQAQLLRLLKCDQIQGYVVARPQPPEQVAQLLGKHLSFDAAGLMTAH